MGLRLVEPENNIIEAALEIAQEWDNNLRRLCDAVLSDDLDTAKILAKELKGREESDRAHKSQHRGAGERR